MVPMIGRIPLQYSRPACMIFAQLASGTTGLNTVASSIRFAYPCDVEDKRRETEIKLTAEVSCAG